MRVGRPVIGSLVLLVAACGAIPLSTLWRLHNFTVDRFFSIDPNALRAAIRVDERARRGAGSPLLEVRVEETDRSSSLCYALPLASVDAQADAEPPLDAKPGRRWYAFGLSAAGAREFERAKRELLRDKRGGSSISLGVSVGDVFSLPADAVRSPIRIDLAFDRDVGYFTLIDEIDEAQEPALRSPAEGTSRPPATADARPRPCAANGGVPHALRRTRGESFA